MNIYVSQTHHYQIKRHLHSNSYEIRRTLDSNSYTCGIIFENIMNVIQESM